MTTPTCRIAAFLAVASLPLACGPISDSRDATDTVVKTETIGDTTVVRTVSGSVWGGDATLVPEVSIGELDGPEEYLFGSVHSIAVDDDHNVYVLDEQARHVRVYDSDGTYVKTLGRDGEGPGEFNVPIGLAISNGRLLVRDPANGRVQLFVLETGENEEWKYLPSRVFVNTPLYQDDQGRIYVDITEIYVDISEEVQRFIVMDSDGSQIDTISPPDAPADFDDGKYVMRARGESGDRRIFTRETVPFSPDWYWTVHPTGHFLSALSTAYRIHLEQDSGVLRIERNHTPVAVPDDERDRHEQRIVNRMRRYDAGWNWDGSPHTGSQAALQGLECRKRWPDLGEAVDGGATGRERGARPEQSRVRSLHLGRAAPLRCVRNRRNLPRGRGPARRIQPFGSSRLRSFLRLGGRAGRAGCTAGGSLQDRVARLLKR